MPNDDWIFRTKNLRIERHPSQFSNYTPRPPIVDKNQINYKTNESKLNKNFFTESLIFSKVKRIPQIDFDKVMPRYQVTKDSTTEGAQPNVFSPRPYTFEYENKDRAKDLSMKRSDHGQIIFDKMPIREIGEGFGGYIGCKNKSDSPIGGIMIK